jgi:hypothetical protein
VYYINLKMHPWYGQRWKVRQARSLRDALDEIAHANCFGSVGGKTILHDNGKQTILADVVRINADNSEVRPS